MRLGPALLVLVFFASGTASGFFVGRSQVVNHVGDIPTRQEILERFTTEVRLDAAQVDAFRKILEANHERFVAVKRRYEPELAAIRSDVRAQLRRTLRDDQQKSRFDAYCNLRDRQRDETMR